MENWMQYVPKKYLNKEGGLKEGYYFPYWCRCQDFFNCRGDFKTMHEALLKFETYCKEHRDELKDMDFVQEISAMIQCIGIKKTRDFAVCGQDDYMFEYYDLDKEPPYFFCWDAGNIIWKFPGNYQGNIWI